MDKQEFKRRLKVLGIKLTEAADEMGYSPATVWEWSEVPRAGYWYLMYKENYAALRQRVLDAIYNKE